jgi:ribA/ribD-fused uncharacterized protein
MIKTFRNDYRFLSNYYPSPFKYEQYYFKTVEHFFQAYKAKWLNDFLKIVSVKTPAEAKKLGRSIELRDGWEEIKIQVMLEGVERKFAYNQPIREALLRTGKQELVEGNTWHDNFWGDCRCKKCRRVQGINMLGSILMTVRFNLQNLKR